MKRKMLLVFVSVVLLLAAGCARKDKNLTKDRFLKALPDGATVVNVPRSEDTDMLKEAIAAYFSENVDETESEQDIPAQEPASDTSRPSSLHKDADPEQCQMEFYLFADDARCQETYNHVRMRLEAAYRDADGFVSESVPLEDGGWFIIGTSDWMFNVCMRENAMIYVTGTSSTGSVARACDFLEKCGFTRN